MTREKQNRPYPLVVCDDHPGIVEPGYVVCVHVMDGAPVAHVLKPTPQTLGEVLCIGCTQSGESIDVENLQLSCAPGVRERGWDKVAVQ